MSKNKESQFIVGSNEYFTAASLLIFRGNNIEESDKQDIVANIEFEVIVTLIKK